MADYELLLVSVGNSRTRVARWRPAAMGLPPAQNHDDGDDRDDAPARNEAARTPVARKVPATGLEPSIVLNNEPAAQLQAAVLAEAEKLGPDGPEGGARVVVASVRDSVADALIDALTASGRRALRLVAPGRGSGGSGGGDRGLAVPMRHALPAPVTVGVDRLLAALGAYSRSGEACVVIDAGTAVTVDFVDQWGTFQGGVIAPGLGAMLSAMHTTAEALPAVDVPRSADAVPAGPFGTTTRDAMVLGAVGAVQGLAHRMIEKYAMAHGSYPRVIATGGDAPLVFREDELVEHVVPDLVLMGMAAAWWTEFGG